MKPQIAHYIKRRLVCIGIVLFILSYGSTGYAGWDISYRFLISPRSAFDEKVDTERFGKKAKEFKEELGITKEELARITKSHPPALGYNMKRNVKPKFELIAKVKGIPLESLQKIAYELFPDFIKIATRNYEVCELIFTTESQIGIETSINEINNIYLAVDKKVRKTEGLTAAKEIKLEGGRKVVEEALGEVLKGRYPHLASDIDSFFSSPALQNLTSDRATSQAI